ncbi:MAG: hypothetical protein JJU21_10455 [Salinarimonas sp.]|nr:hypothetical protein [Salinarimonas sp.]
MTLTRRFRLAPGFARLIGRERHAMPVVEGHFPDQSDRRSFLRLEGESCTLVLQDLLPDGGVSEERTEVSRAQGEVLMDVCAGRVVYERMPFEGGGGLDVEILRFVSPLPCAFILLHFNDSMQANGFRPPLWFGAELTQEETCEPRLVALGRKPAAHDGSIQNAALESLLDHLETRSGRHGSTRGLGDLVAHAPAQPAAPAQKSAASAAPASSGQSTSASTPAPEAVARAAPRPVDPAAVPPRQGQPARPRATPSAANAAPIRPSQGDPGDDQDQIFDDGARKPAQPAPRVAGRQG